MFAAAAIYAVIVLRFRFLSFLPVAYSTLVHNLPDGILILDIQNRLIEMNPAAERLLNSDKRWLKYNPVSTLLPQLSDLLDRLQDGMNAELSLDSPQGARFFTVNQVILRNARSEVVGKLVTIRDITELKNTHRELENEMQKRSQYSRALVHELRTPLTSIVASSDLLESVVKQPIELSLTRNIQRAAHNLEQRVSELFELARGEVGLLTIEPLALDLCLLMDEVVAELGPVAKQKGLSLAGECTLGLEVMGDKGRLHQVISNLLSNAIKFTEEGQIKIRLSRSDDDQMALVQVSDSGPGIAPEQMVDLFDPYLRKSPAGRSNVGLGIGLALSRIIVELHKGRIWAESPPGRGATLSFTLPLLKH
jgi:two-component system clock-associated histidine kinase SasA